MTDNARMYQIICCIENELVSDEEKGWAIERMLNMPTHNGITKDMMLSIINWLMHRFYEIEGD